MTIDCVSGWTDEKIRDRVGDLPVMRSMILGGPNVTDEGMELLGEHCVNLKELHLCSASVTDEGLKHVGRIKSLDWIVIDETPVTDEGVKYLSFLTDLKGLHLVKTNVSDEGLSVLFHFPKLKYLEAASPCLGSNGLSTISQVLSLEILRLASLKTEDDEFLNLAFSPMLRQLTIWMPRVTRDAIEQMNERLPGCLINQLAVRRTPDKLIYVPENNVQLIKNNLYQASSIPPLVSPGSPPADSWSVDFDQATNRLTGDQVKDLIALGLLKPSDIIDPRLLWAVRKEEPSNQLLAPYPFQPRPEQMLLDKAKKRKKGEEESRIDVPWSW